MKKQKTTRPVRRKKPAVHMACENCGQVLEYYRGALHGGVKPIGVCEVCYYVALNALKKSEGVNLPQIVIEKVTGEIRAISLEADRINTRLRWRRNADGTVSLEEDIYDNGIFFDVPILQPKEKKCPRLS